MENFSEIGLSEQFVKELEKMDIKNPTEIQEQTIPLAMDGKDIIGGSATGSGKTLAFSAPIIEHIETGIGPQALILTPTRELAEQIVQAVKKFSKWKKLNTIAIYGGVGIEPQIKRLSNSDIVVGTPGRILDHLGRGTIDLRKVKYLILDEVDRMFDMGFQDDVRKIIKEVPTERQTLLFSATITRDVGIMAEKYTKNPYEISVDSYVDPSKLKQVYYDTPDHLKFSALVHLLNEEKSGLVMVFCATRRNVDFVAKNLQKQGIDAKAIHGGLSQNKRTRVLDAFHNNGVTILVCTDVAARGLDIKNVTHVYNYDLPKCSEDYVHRIGRTARAGEEGKAIIILTSRDYENFDKVKMDESLNIKREDLPFIKQIEVKKDFGRSGGRGRRDSRQGGRSQNRRGSRDSRGRDSKQGGRGNGSIYRHGGKGKNNRTKKPKTGFRGRKHKRN